MRSTSTSQILVPMIVACALFMQNLDSTIVATALPAIADSLHEQPLRLNLAITSYLLSLAVFIPLSGWMADRFGARTVFCTAIAVFTLGSAGCGQAHNLPELIASRILQGMGGAMMVPVGRLVLLRTVPKAQLVRALAFLSLPAMIGPVIGPPLGGFIVTYSSWRWIFYINLPIGVAAVLMTRMFIFDPPYLRRVSTRIDSWGIGFLALGIGSLQIMLDKGQEDDWFGSRFITWLAILTVLGLGAFIIRELMAENPVVHLRVFKNRTYASGTALMTMLGFVLYGSLVALPIFIQTLLGYPPAKAGMALAPRGLGSFCGMPLVGVVIGKIDARKLLVVGLLGSTVSLVELSHLNLNAGYWDLFWPQFFQGLFLSMLFVPLTTVTMDPIPREEMGNATSLLNLMRNIGGSVGIATATTMVARTSQTFQNTFVRHINPNNPVAMAQLQHFQSYFQSRGADPVTAMKKAYAAVYGIVQQQAALLSYLNIFKFFGYVFLLMLPLLFLMKRPARADRPTAMH